MRQKLAQTILALAARTLGTRRHQWAQAMHSELDAAVEDGRPVLFAMGCLVAAWRQLPRQSEGRLALASHALALGLIVPLAALSLWIGLLGYPYLSFGEVDIWGFLAGRSEQIPLLVYGETGMAPAMTMIVLLQAAGQLLLAWFLLEQDWDRVEAVGGFNAATLTTLAIVMGLLTLLDITILISVALLITETMAVLSLAWWHQHLLHDTPVATSHR